MIVSFKNTSCGWEATDSNGLKWAVAGDGAGHWTLTITDVEGSLVWSGSKSGGSGTREGDTPEGAYTRTSGRDPTPQRDISMPCSSCPEDAGDCCDQYEVTVLDTGTDQDGEWVLLRYGNQPFWSSANGGSGPAGSDGEMRLYCDGRTWAAEMVSASVNFKYTSRNDGFCPRTTGWTQLSSDSGSVTISVNASTCSSSGNRVTSSSSSSLKKHSTSSLSSSSSSTKAKLSSSSDTSLSSVSSLSSNGNSDLSSNGNTDGADISSSSTSLTSVSSPSSFPAFVGCDEFSWSRPRTGEPQYYRVQDSTNFNATTFSVMSSSAQIDLSYPHIKRLVFGDSTNLDDILILIKGEQSIVETYTPGLIDDDHGNPVSFTVPQGAIFFTNTSGWFCNDFHPDRRASAQKTFIEVDGDGLPTGRQHVIPQGNEANQSTGSGADFAADGFTVRNFADGISIADLDALGFLDAHGVMSFRFAHVVAGAGHVFITNMTCSLDQSDSSLSSDSGDRLSSLTTNVDCLSQCGNCCAQYVIYLSGGTAIDDEYAFNRTSSTSCLWVAGSSTLSAVSGKWQLHFVSGSNSVVLEADNCTVCPPTRSSAWRVVSNNTGGSPQVTLNVLDCDPVSDSSLSSSSSLSSFSSDSSSSGGHPAPCTLPDGLPTEYMLDFDYQFFNDDAGTLSTPCEGHAMGKLTLNTSNQWVFTPISYSSGYESEYTEYGAGADGSDIFVDNFYPCPQFCWSPEPIYLSLNSSSPCKWRLSFGVTYNCIGCSFSTSSDKLTGSTPVGDYPDASDLRFNTLGNCGNMIFTNIVVSDVSHSSGLSLGLHLL